MFKVHCANAMTRSKTVKHIDSSVKKLFWAFLICWGSAVPHWNDFQVALCLQHTPLAVVGPRKGLGTSSTWGRGWIWGYPQIVAVCVHVGPQPAPPHYLAVDLHLDSLGPVCPDSLKSKSQMCAGADQGLGSGTLSFHTLCWRPQCCMWLPWTPVFLSGPVLRPSPGVWATKGTGLASFRLLRTLAPSSPTLLLHELFLYSCIFFLLLIKCGEMGEGGEIVYPWIYHFNKK